MAVPAEGASCALSGALLALGLFVGFQGGPVFKQVASFALESLRIPPTGTKPPGLKLTTH